MAAALRPCALALLLALAGGPLPDAAHAAAASRAQAIEQALAMSGGRGRVLGVREERGEGGTVYAVKVLTDGRVRVYRIPAAR